MCGEKISAEIVGSGVVGSPPRVRGKGCCFRRNENEFRITPACAGKSTSSYPAVCVLEDHPRVCGEKESQSFQVAVVKGSPPRVRGKGEIEVDKKV